MLIVSASRAVLSVTMAFEFAFSRVVKEAAVLVNLDATDDTAAERSILSVEIA